MATILTIIPYSFYPPTNGGALRCFYILKEMAREHEVYVLTRQPLHDFEKLQEPAFPANVQIISTAGTPKYTSFINSILPHPLADALNYRFLKQSLKGSASSYFLEVYPVLSSLLHSLTFDVFFYENLEALGLFGSLINSKNPSAIKLYDAHNVDSELWLQRTAAEQKPEYGKYAKSALAIERTLFKRAEAFFCCSEEDRAKLMKLNNNRISGYTIPNGVSLEARPFDKNEAKYKIKNILFCGSLNYFPNKEGLLWFYANVYSILKKEQPAITLTVIGHMQNRSDFEVMQKDPSVHLIGNVESVVPYYRQSSVAIVPLLSGSGTRLKILEAMSMGNPIVSTTVGAEGLNYAMGEHLMIADQPEAFAESIQLLLSDQNSFNTVRAHALELVKKNYDWKKIGIKLNLEIKKFIQ